MSSLRDGTMRHHSNAADYYREYNLSLDSKPGRPAEYQSPFQIATFSYNAEREQVFDDSSLKYYVEPPPNANLTYRFDNWKRKPEDRTRLDPLLAACAQNKLSRAETKRADVITWRGVLTKIFTAPYETRDGWDLNVMFVNGTLYIEEHMTPQRLQEKENMNPRQAMNTYTGYAFESFCTRDEPRSSGPGWGGDVNTSVQWCSIIKSKLDDLRIVIGGEVDCVRDRYTGQPDTFVELKTTMSAREDDVRSQKLFEVKLLRFFMQSFLLGVPEIVVGLKSRENTITNVISYKTSWIPKMVREGFRQWDHKRCLSSARDTFKWIQEVAAAHQDSNEEKHVWRLTLKPGSGLTLRIVTPQELAEVHEGEDRVGFLLREYWGALQSDARR